MERKIGDTFEFFGDFLNTLVVKENVEGDCLDCFFFLENYACFVSQVKDLTGECIAEKRSDKKNVIFIEAKED